MPLYRFFCQSCEREWRKLLAAGQQKLPQPCRKCTNLMVRVPGAPSTQVLEELDNGLMAKKVTRLKDAEKLAKERAASDPRNKPLD